MDEIESLGQWVTLHKGQVLFRQDETGDGRTFWSMDCSGSWCGKRTGSSRVVNHIQHGEIVGEMALLQRRAPLGHHLCHKGIGSAVLRQARIRGAH